MIGLGVNGVGIIFIKDQDRAFISNELNVGWYNHGRV